MASNDVVTKADIEGLKIYIDGRLKGVEDRISGVENRITGIENRITGVEQAIGEVKTEVRINAVKIEEVKNSMNWNFATLALVVAIVGFTITLAPMFREIFREKHREKRDEEIRSMIRDEFAKLKGNPQ